MSADLSFSTILSICLLYCIFFTPATLGARWKALNQTGHMLGRISAMWNACPKCGVSPPPTNRGPKANFSTTSQLRPNGKFNDLYLRIEIWYRQSGKCVDDYKGSATSFQTENRELWSTNGFKLHQHFYLPYVNSVLYFIARLRKWRSAKGTQPNGRL